MASNPEFLRQGSGIYDTLYPDRVVVGSEDARAIDVLANLYRPLLNQDFPAPAFLPRPEGLSAVPLVTCDLASAELIKYAANAFLALKISYTNEIAHLAAKVGADITPNHAAVWGWTAGSGHASCRPASAGAGAVLERIPPRWFRLPKSTGWRCRSCRLPVM